MSAVGQGRDQGPPPKHEAAVAVAISLLLAASVLVGLYVSAP